MTHSFLEFHDEKIMSRENLSPKSFHVICNTLKIFKVSQRSLYFDYLGAVHESKSCLSLSFVYEHTHKQLPRQILEINLY